MAPSSNTVDEAASLIRERIKELDAERAQLERALASLTGGREGRRGPGRPQARRAQPRGRRRRRRGGTRADQAVKLVSANPGISASEIAAKMKIKPNYLYRVLAELEKEGRVRKDGRAYHPAADRTAPQGTGAGVTKRGYDRPMGIGARARTSAARVVALLSLAALTAAAPASGHPAPTRQQVNPLPVQQALEPPLTPTPEARVRSRVAARRRRSRVRSRAPTTPAAARRRATPATPSWSAATAKAEPAGHGRRVQGRALRRRRRPRLRVLRHDPARPDQPDRRRGRGQRARHVGPGEPGADRQARHPGDALAARVAGRQPEARRARRGARQPGVLPGHRRRLRHLRRLPPPGAQVVDARSASSATRAAWPPTAAPSTPPRPATQTLVAVDISNLSAPVPLWIGPYDSHGLSISDDGNRAYVAGVGSGLIILDVSEIQARVPNPQVREVARLHLGLDEHPAERDPGDHRRPPLRGRDRRVRDPGRGRRRADHRHRRRDQPAGGLEPAARGAPAGELRRSSAATPGAQLPLQGYAGHYCNVPKRVDPGIVACSMILSGLRVFDIRDPAAPARDRLLQRPDRAAR